MVVLKKNTEFQLNILNTMPASNGKKYKNFVQEQVLTFRKCYDFYGYHSNRP